jgi:hypothetical protein
VYVDDPIPMAPEPPAPPDLAVMAENGRGLFIVSVYGIVWPEVRAQDKTMHAVVAHPSVELTDEDIALVVR